jgi:hypothetical protein
MNPALLRLLLLLAASLAAAPAGHAATFLISQSSSCASGGCEFAPDMTGPGATTNISRLFEDPPANPGSLLMMNQAAMTVVSYGGFSASVSSTGDLNDYPVGGQGFTGPNIAANAKATIWDVVTVSGSSGPGTLRMMWHVTGSVDIGWSVTGPVEDIDHGQVSLAFLCAAQQVGSPTPGNCPDPALTWTDDAAVDEMVNVDVPIVFGAPEQYQLGINLQSSIGTGVYTASTGLIAFMAHANGGFGSTGTLAGVEALDGIGQPVPGATIQSESGFQYDVAPEPGGPLLVTSGSLVLVLARRRSVG